MKAAAFDYVKPGQLKKVMASLSEREGDAKVMSGGCSLGPMLNLRLARPSLIVDVRGLSEMRRVHRTKDGLIIGAGWTHAEIEDGALPDIARGFLPRVAHGIAYRAVRNRGTIGGSLAHADPAADWITSLTALDAKLLIDRATSSRRSGIPSFMIAAYTTDLADDEVLTAIEIPVLSEAARWGYNKVCRKTGEFAHAIGAVVIDPPRKVCRVVCGAIEAPPVLLPKTADALLTRGVAEAVAASRDEVDNLLSAHGEVFRQLHRTAVERALIEASQ